MNSWLTQSQICNLTGWDPRHLRRKVASGDLLVRCTRKLAANGKPIKEYAADSLPESVRAKLESRGELASGNTARCDGSPSLFPAASQETPRVKLTPEAERAAEERLAIIQPLREFISDPSSRARFAQLKTADGKKVSTSNHLAIYLAELHSGSGKKVSARTIWNWKKTYTEQGLHGLARGIRSDKGRSRFFLQNPRAAQLVASTYLRPYQTAVTAYNALVRDRELLGIAEEDLPTYNTVRAYLESLPAPIKVLAREGDRAHNERMSLYLQRAYEDVAANSVWVSDHMLHDVFVWNDIFPSEQDGKMMRLRLTMILDMRTRKPVGYSWTPEGSSASIKSALRRAVAAYGPCEMFYCDNGKDFKKVARGGSLLALPDEDSAQLDLEIAEIDRRGVLTRLGIPTQHCIKYHPQSKHIERFFRTLHLQFDAKFSAYTTGNAYLRPDAANVLSIQHRKLAKLGQHRDSKLMPASVFISMCAMWLEEVYANASHRGKGMDGLSPNQIFEAGYPIGQRRAIDPVRLEELLWESKLVKVRETAVVLNKRRYMAVDPHGNSQLYLANEGQVRIHYDPNDMDRAVVTDLDGRKIASVQAERLTAHSVESNPETQAQIAASMQERRRLRNASAEAIRGLHRSVRQAGHTSDLQDIYERALLPAAVNDLVTQRAPQTATAEPQVKHLHSEDIGDRLADRLRRNNGTHG